MPAVNQWLDHKGTVVDSVNDFDVIECEACGFKHIVPIPSCDELDPIYREDYFTVKHPFYFEHQREDSEWWDNVFLKRYVLFECQLPPHRRRILDIGSGSGLFLRQGMKRGWETLGVEPSRPAAEQARQLGLSIVNEFLARETIDGAGAARVARVITSAIKERNACCQSVA